MTKITLILSIFLFLIIFHVDTLPSEIGMQIKTIFEDYHKQGHWLPLRIEIDSNGESFIGNISVTVYDGSNEQTYITPISTIGNSKWEKYLYIRPDEVGKIAKVKLTDNNNKLILEKEIRFNIISEDSKLIVVVDQDGKTLNIDQSQKIYVANLEVEELPNKWIGYDIVDAVVLGNFSSDSISENQRQALIDWLYSGGTLIVSGGSDSQNLIGSFIEPFLPVKIKGVKVIQSIPSMSNYFGYELPNTPTVVALSELDMDSRVIIAEEDGLPIISEKHIGIGEIVFLGYNFSDPIFNSWKGNNELWSLILNLKDKLKEPNYENISRFISENSRVIYPSYKIIGIFLFSYLLCISLIGYAFLKRNSSKILPIISLIVIIFAIFAFGFNYITGEKSSTIADYSIVYLHKDSQRVRIRSFFSPFSPNKSEIKLDFNDVNAVFIEKPTLKSDGSGVNLTLLQDDTSQMVIRNLKSLRNTLFYAKLYIDLKENVSISMLSNDQIEIMNNIHYDITDCYLFWGDRYAKIGTVPFNSHYRFSLDRSFSGNVFDNYSVEDEKKSKFLNLVKSSLLHDNINKVFVGWIDGSALQKFANMSIDSGYKPYGNCLIIEVL